MKINYIKIFILSCILFFGCNVAKIDGLKTWDHLPIAIQRSEYANGYDEEIINVYNEFFGQEIFALVDPEEDVDCTVDFVDQISDQDDESPYGRTYLDFENGFIVSCHIEIDNGVPFISVYAHELGHVLGSPHFDTGIMQHHAPSSNIENLVNEIDGELSAWIYYHYLDLLTASE